MERMKMKLLVVACALLIGVGAASFGVAYTAGGDDARAPMIGPPCHHRGGGPNLLGRYLHENMVVEVVSQLSKQSAETVGQQIKEKPLPFVLDEYKIDPKSFHAAMEVKKTSQVNQFVTDGYLSSEQGKAILGEMADRTRRHELMAKVIKKALADGTISAQEAQLLEPPHHKPMK